MGIKVATPLTSPRALIKIVSVKGQDSQYRDKLDRPQTALVCDLQVVGGAGPRDGERFSEYLNIPVDGDGDLEIRKGTKAGQAIFAALKGEIHADDDADKLAERLAGKLFVAAIGLSKSGEYSRLTHDTIAPS